MKTARHALSPGQANEAALTQICAMGFDRAEAQRALEAAFGDASRAVEYNEAPQPSDHVLTVVKAGESVSPMFYC